MCTIRSVGIVLAVVSSWTVLTLHPGMKSAFYTKFMKNNCTDLHFEDFLNNNIYNKFIVVKCCYTSDKQFQFKYNVSS